MPKDLVPRARLAALLGAPVGWLGIVYLGSLVILLLNALWTRDAFSGATVYEPTFANFAELLGAPYPGIALRTVVMAVLVTVTCAVIAFPISFYMARVAAPRTRGLLAVAILIPLWASYLVKIYAWRVILAEEGLTAALIMVAVVLVYQQVENNILSPTIYGKAVDISAFFIITAAEGWPPRGDPVGRLVRIHVSLRGRGGLVCFESCSSL